MTPSNASGYQLAYSSSDPGVAAVDGNGKVTAKKAGTATVRVTVVQPGGTRTIREVLVSVAAEKVTVKKVSGVKVKNQKNGKVKLTWKKADGASGYQIYRSAKKTKGFKKIAEVGVSKKAYTDKKAGKKTVYYKVRAFRDAGGKKVYGKFSKVIKRTVKK